MILHVAFFGIGVPLFIIYKYRLSLLEKVDKISFILGIAVLLLGLFINLFNPDGILVLLNDPPPAYAILKYLLLFLPMSFGICLQCFYLIPTVIRLITDRPILQGILMPISSGLSLSIGFAFDTLFTNWELVSVMFIMGLIIGMSWYLIRSFIWIYLTFSLMILVNTLVEGKYYHYPWTAVIIGFLSSLLIVVYFLIKRASNRIT